MDNIEKSEVVIDKQIPIERQIDFLRNRIFDRDLTVYSVLKEELGEEGERLNNLIKVRLMNKGMEGMAKEIQYFEKAKDIPAYPDRILGYRVEVDYDSPEESQLTLKGCPFYKKAKEYGLEKEICKLICDFEVEQAKERGFGELMILSKLSEGADKCSFKFKKAKK